jgi:hypothetical protein
VDPAVLPTGQLPVTLTLVAPAASSPYGSQQEFTAITTHAGLALSGLPVIFTLGGQGRMALTDGNGRATVNFFLASVPDDYTLDVVFTGTDEYAPAASSSSFKIQPGPTTIVLNPEVQIIPPGANAKFIATLKSSGLPLAGKSVALTLDSGGIRQYTSVAVTDYAGQARWEVPAQLPGSYAVKTWFGLPVSVDLELSSPFYVGSFDTGSLINQIVFNGFFSPVANPPIVNKVTAGSAVPIKFSLGGDIGLNIFAAGYPKLVKATCQVLKTNYIKNSGAAASSLSYDRATGIYTYNWKTDKKLAGSCGALVLKFVDGSEKTLLFQFSR